MTVQLPISSPSDANQTQPPELPGALGSDSATGGGLFAKPDMDPRHQEGAHEVRAPESPTKNAPPSFFNSRNIAWRYASDTRLHVACFDGDLRTAVSLLQQSPQALSAVAADGDLPIHRAAASKSSQALEVVKLLLEAAPNQIYSEGFDGELPLHVACAWSPSVALVRLLMDRDPKSVKQKNGRGDLAVHRACMNRGPDRDAIVKAVVEAHPDTVLASGAQGHLALHRACYCSSLTTVKYLIQIHPGALREADNKGQVPHTASLNVTHPLGSPILPQCIDVVCPCACK